MESKNRSILKTITWRILAIITSYIVAYFFTKSSSVSINLVLVSNAVSMILYYYHERVWSELINIK